MSDEQWRREYMCEFIHDPLYEHYVQAWLHYHQAADIVDRGSMDSILIKFAAKAGQAAMDAYLNANSLEKPRVMTSERKLWKLANLEAIRKCRL